MKKVLVVSKVPTHPMCAGNRNAIMAQIEALKELGCEVHFLYVFVKPLLKKGDDQSFISTKAFWGDNFHLYRVSKLEKLIINIRNYWHKFFLNYYVKCDDWYPVFLHHYVNKLNMQYNFDICIANYFYLSKLFEYIKIPKKALLTHDNYAYKDLAINTRADACIDANQSAKAMQRSPYIFALQDEEFIFFKLLSPRSKVYNIYSLFDFHSNDIVGNKNILFMSGSNIYNINGLDWFISTIFPAIVSSFPDCKLVIGGSICKAIDSKYHDNHIVKYGYVENLESFYAIGDVCINPVFQGTGLKIKTFESISYDKVTMVHPHSTIGIYRKSESPLFYSTDPQLWVEYLGMIWHNKETISNLKKRNKEYITSLRMHVMDTYRSFLDD